MPRMICIGTGGGPKNVLVELDDGSRVVVTYMTWKYKYKPKGNMAEKKATYVSVSGFVQFEPNEREYDGGQIRDISVKPQGEPEKLIRVTLWPEWEDAPVERGDFVAAEGLFTRDTYQANDGTKKVSLQINAKRLNVNGKRYDAKRDDAPESDDSSGDDLF